MVIKLLISVGIVLALTIALRIAVTIYDAKPKNLSSDYTSLQICPDTANCVCSCEERESHRVDPIGFDGDTAPAMRALLTIINAQNGSVVVTQTHNYLHVTFKSRLIGYVDDVEFLINENTKKIDVRSASRIGQGDFGANRKRVENIRNQFQASQ
ncbi:MAG: DUF1499 domain-containing protein [Pseudomonadota bacterium]